MMLANIACDLGYRPSKAGPDSHLQRATKPKGLRHHDVLLACSDDMLSISHDPFKAINGIRSVFKLKEDRATVPEMCLGGEMSEVENLNGTKCWTMSSEKDVKAAVSNVEEKLAQTRMRLPSKRSSPFSAGYHPNEDVTPELDSE